MDTKCKGKQQSYGAYQNSILVRTRSKFVNGLCKWPLLLVNIFVHCVKLTFVKKEWIG